MTDAVSREAEIRARCEAATPGPWHDTECTAEQPDGSPCWCRWIAVDTDPAGNNEWVLPTGAMKAADATFAAHARSDIPWLLDQVAALRAQLAEERERVAPLVAFARWALSEMRTDGGGDIDGGAAEDKAVALGVLVPVTTAAPCGDCCNCAEYGEDFPVDCMRYSPAMADLLASPETLAAIEAGIVAAREGRVTPWSSAEDAAPTTEEPGR